MLVLKECPVLFDAPVAGCSAEFAHQDFTPDAAARWGVELPDGLREAVSKRKAEYVAGRVCATRAIRSLLQDFDGRLERSSRHRMPEWPRGLVGSITHTGGFASAAIARSDVARGIGIDTEHVMTEEVMREVRDAVRSRLETPCRVGGQVPEAVYTTLVFSAKESVFKCIYPLVQKMFWFHHARVDIVDLPGGAFRATLLVDLSDEFRTGTVLQGRFRVRPPYVHTGVLLAA